MRSAKKYMAIREKLRPYTRELMRQAHEKGTPVMRTLFYEYPEDETCWETEDEYLYGSDILVAPVFEPGCRKRRLYLPEGRWQEYETKKVHEGRQWIEIPVTLETMPVFVKMGKEIL